MTDSDFEFWELLETCAAGLKCVMHYSGKELEILEKEPLEDILEKASVDLFRAIELMDETPMIYAKNKELRELMGRLNK